MCFNVIQILDFYSFLIIGNMSFFFLGTCSITSNKLVM
jgi:hypothetical protein